MSHTLLKQPMNGGKQGINASRMEWNAESKFYMCSVILWNEFYVFRFANYINKYLVDIAKHWSHRLYCMEKF